MHWHMIVLRLLHIVLGSIWVGTVVFNTIFLGPTVRDLGPDGGKVMGALVKRGMMTFLPIVALGTLLTGLWLFWKVSLGFDHDYLLSGPGHAFGIGGLLAIIAYALGLTVMRPAMLRVTALAQTMAQLSTDAERAARQQEMQTLRSRASTAGQVVATLLVLATAMMAVARYL